MTLKTALSAAVAFAMCTFVSVASAQHQQSFSYPIDATQQCSGGCQDGCGHVGGRFGANIGNGALKAKIDHHNRLAEKVRAREDAWPKPFACWDKRAYHSIWEPMLTTGFNQSYVLGNEFFNDDNTLSRIGISRVANIMQYMPQSKRVVMIQEASDQAVNKARMENVKFTIDTYYAQLGTAKIDLTRHAPSFGHASVLQSRLENRRVSLDAPIIRIGTGGSVAQEVGN